MRKGAVCDPLQGERVAIYKTSHVWG